MKHHRIHLRATIAIAMMTATALMASCTNPPPAGGFTYVLFASRITNVTFKGDYPLTFWDNDKAEEPYLVHLGLRLQATPTIDVKTWVTSTYFNNGAYIAKIGAQQTINMGKNDGLVFTGVDLPDILDLNGGTPLQILGSVEFLFERDQLIPFGIAQVLQGVSQLINAALPTVLANNLALPKDPQGIITFLGKLLPGVFATIVGVIGAAIGSITGGDPLIGFSPQLYLAVGGTLGNIISGAIPSLLPLVEFALEQQDPNPFPDGLPFQIGVVGHSLGTHFGTAPRTSTYDVSYGWARVRA